MAAKQTGAAVGLANSLPVRPDATYLVTGGLGGIGFALAGWLVDQGARHLLLLGRRNANDEQRRLLQAFEARGAQIAVRSVNVGDADILAQTFQEVRDGMPPLSGVFHAGRRSGRRNAASTNVGSVCTRGGAEGPGRLEFASTHRTPASRFLRPVFVGGRNDRLSGAE